MITQAGGKSIVSKSTEMMINMIKEEDTCDAKHDKMSGQSDHSVGSRHLPGTRDIILCKHKLKRPRCGGFAIL